MELVLTGIHLTSYGRDLEGRLGLAEAVKAAVEGETGVMIGFERLPGAEDACISQEQLEIVEWYRKVKFRKNLLGGVDEVQMWKKLEELYGLYENAIRAERARYNALLEAHTPPGENHEEGC